MILFENKNPSKMVGRNGKYIHQSIKDARHKIIIKYCILNRLYGGSGTHIDFNFRKIKN